jgi:CheY-like chemotaxis protein/DNA-binding Xre family transcriptional regulator
MEQSSRITILLVDDHEEVRSLMARILREGGYHVVEASDAAAALDVIALGTQVELLVTDVVMPGLSGFELASHVTAACKVPVLFLSTFALTGDDIPGPVLQKPFTPSVLLDAVRGLLALTDPARAASGSTLMRAAADPEHRRIDSGISRPKDQISVLLSLDAWHKHRKSGVGAPQVWHITSTAGGMVRWRVADLLKERQWSAYRLVQESRLAHPLVYRIAKAGRQVKRVNGNTLDALCRTFGVGPGELFEYVPPVADKAAI